MVGACTPLTYDDALAKLQRMRTAARHAAGRRTSKIRGVWEHEYHPVLAAWGFKRHTPDKPVPLRRFVRQLGDGFHVVKVTRHLVVAQVTDGYYVRDQQGTYPIERSWCARKLVRRWWTRTQ